MAAKRTGLGKGLDSLITNRINTANINNAINIDKQKENTPQKVHVQETSAGTGEPVKVSIGKVEPNQNQPRKKFNEDSLEELSESIKQVGIIQPLIVQKIDDYYEIIAGERRWRAAKHAGLKEVPVIIRTLNEQQKMEISLIENIQRENLNPIEEAQAYRKLIEEFGLKQDEMAERVSKSRTSVTNSMRLLKLNEKVQQMIIDEMITTGHARALIPIEDEKLQYETAQQVFDQKLSVRETEKLVKSLMTQNHKKDKKNIDPALDAIYRSLEEQMKKITGTKVTINSKDEKSGRVEIEYYSKDDLEKIVDILKGK